MVTPHPVRGRPVRRDINGREYWDRTHVRWVDEGWLAVFDSERRSGPWPVVLDALPHEGRLLDVGCSAGLFLQYLREHRPQLVLTGVDISPKGARLASAAVPEAQVVAGNGEILPFADGAFDVVYSGHFVEHMVDPVVTLREQRRVLVSGGRVIVHFPYSDVGYVEHVHDNLRFADVREWLDVAGFHAMRKAPLVNGAAVLEGIMWGTRI